MSDKDHRNVASYVLQTAHKVVTTERGNQHGGAEDSFKMIADLWATYLNNTNRNTSQPEDLVRVTAYDVAQMMTLLKVARAVHGNASNEDNYVDAAGYQSLAAAIAGVQAPLAVRPAAPTPAPAPRREPTQEEVDKASTAALAAKLAPRADDRLSRIAEGEI